MAMVSLDATVAWTFYRFAIHYREREQPRGFAAQNLAESPVDLAEQLAAAALPRPPFSASHLAEWPSARPPSFAQIFHFSASLADSAKLKKPCRWRGHGS